MLRAIFFCHCLFARSLVWLTNRGLPLACEAAVVHFKELSSDSTQRTNVSLFDEQRDEELVDGSVVSFWNALLAPSIARARAGIDEALRAAAICLVFQRNSAVRMAIE